MTFYCVFIVVLFSFIVMPRNGISYEREITLGDEYRVEREKEKKTDRFRLELSMGYGYSYAQIMTGLYGVDPKMTQYLKQTNMEWSDNLGVFRLTSTYLLTPDLGVYLAIPFGIVQTKTEQGIERLFEEYKTNFGIGDVYGGLYYQLLSEKKYAPGVVLFADVNSDTAKYYSLGDGLWDLTAGTRLTKSLADSFYVFAICDYTYRFKKGDLNPGDVIGYGGGFGVPMQQAALEFGLKAASIDKTKLNSATLFENTDDLAFNFALRHLYKGVSFNLTVGNLNKGFSMNTNTVGVELSFPIY